MDILDSLLVKYGKEGKFEKIVPTVSGSISNPPSTDKSGTKAQPNKQVDMGIFKLAEGTFESMVNAGIKNKITISVISKEFENMGLNSSNEPLELARGINKVFKKYKIDLKAEVKSKNQISIIKYEDEKAKS